MTRPPLIMRLRVQNGSRCFSCYLPLFLVLPPIILLILVLIPFVLIAAMLLWHAGLGRPILLAGPALCRCICALRGLEVDAGRGSERVFVSFR